MRGSHSPAHRPRRPGVGRGNAKAGKHLRAIKQAVPKQRAEWMELVHGVNVLRMDEEQQKFVNSHYRQLVNRGLNLAEARDVVELANAEYYGAIAFHRHVSVTDLLACRQEESDVNGRAGGWRRGCRGRDHGHHRSDHQDGDDLFRVWKTERRQFQLYLMGFF